MAQGPKEKKGLNIQPLLELLDLAPPGGTCSQKTWLVRLWDMGTDQDESSVAEAEKLSSVTTHQSLRQAA